MDRFLLLLFLWSSGVRAEDTNKTTEPDVELRLVGGARDCSGTLELTLRGDKKPVFGFRWSLKTAAFFCQRLDCGSAVAVEVTQSLSLEPAWWIKSDCILSRADVSKCAEPMESTSSFNITCSDSVRLLDGPSLCSGRLEVKTNHSHQYNQSEQHWSSVCETDFDLQDAEVVCRELGCGAPSALQGALYGEVENGLWSSEFQCGGNESALLDCGNSGSARKSCSPGKAVGLTCSDSFIRLVGGASRCSGNLEMKHLEKWRLVIGFTWTLKQAAAVCQRLDCGSALSIDLAKDEAAGPRWLVDSDCVHSGSTLRECSASFSSALSQNVTCSDSVRLLDGPSLCSGRLEVKTNHSHQYNQSEQRWSSVCETDFDLQDAEVVCRELGCGAPSALQGALYGEVETGFWSSEFQCGGNESALLDCGNSGSARKSCSPGKAVGLTCSDPNELRLIGGSSRCAGILEVTHAGEWRPVDVYDWSSDTAPAVCQRMDCGLPVSVNWTEASDTLHWKIKSDCIHSGTNLRECTSPVSGDTIMNLTCSDSVRLLNGSSLCSGRLEVKINHSHHFNQSDLRWSSVCEADFDLQDAEVVCRELGCGAPSALQGALYGEVETGFWSSEFQCGGNESALLDCGNSGSARKSCSPGKAVGLTCSESEEFRLVSGVSRCAGTLELNLKGDRRLVLGPDWTLKTANFYCQHLDCGSAVLKAFGNLTDTSPVWVIYSECVGSSSPVRACAEEDNAVSVTEIICSDLLHQPFLSLSPSMVGVSEAQQQVLRGSVFSIGCSVQPQFPGGSFRLSFTSDTTSLNFSQPSVNHSAQFRFPAAELGHQGNYSCVYDVYVFNHHFSSRGHTLPLRVYDPTGLISRGLVLPLTVLLLLLVSALCLYRKLRKKQNLRKPETLEPVYYNLGGEQAVRRLAEDDEAQEPDLVLLNLPTPT